MSKISDRKASLLNQDLKGLGNKMKQYKWVFIPLLYLIVLAISHFYTTLPHQENPEFSLNADSIVVFIQDPLKWHSINEEKFDGNRQILNMELTDQSFHGNAIRLRDSLNVLGVTNYHVVGEGLGGTVAIHLTKLDSGNVSSLVLIDSNGIEELELLGGYHLNQAIYRVKKVFHQVLFYGIPHFGYLNEHYQHILRSKVQIASDQRAIRPILSEIEVPVSIIHTDKARINESVSREHHRVLPQSNFLSLNDQNPMLEIASFITNVEDGVALTRPEVSLEAQIRSLKPFNPENGVRAEGTGLILLMLVIILSTLISEDLTCIGTGLMIARGLIGFFPGTLACLVGIFFGDILLYLAGRWLASSTLHKAPLKWFITEKDIQLSYHWFQAKGPSIIIASRFIPGTRFPTYFSAGAIGASFGMFILYFGVASIIWTPILVGLALLLGNEMIEYFSLYQEYALWVLVGVLAILFVLFKIIIPSFTFKGRRLLIGWIKRKRNWEFWSPFIIYLPVLIATAWLWIKYRSITLVTLANPGIEFGGIVNESKSAILNSIKDSSSIARFQCIDGSLSSSEKIELIDSFMKTHSLDFPIVIKPDVGERGKGVSIPKNQSQLELTLLHSSENLIVQEYIDGEEYGVFYYRYPSSTEGTIYSITRKKYMWLEGDGEHTLEELILRDPRAVCLAEKHFEQHVDHLFSIPKKGKRISLVEIGTHSRGSIFEDAIHLNSSHLTEQINEISKSFEGFYFGRFDIKVPTEQHLRDGNNLKVLEVNGITSEATHIYDSKYSVFYAIKVLIAQWKLAYKIASEVKEQNPELNPPGLVKILGLLR